MKNKNGASEGGSPEPPLRENFVVRRAALLSSRKIVMKNKIGASGDAPSEMPKNNSARQETSPPKCQKIIVEKNETPFGGRFSQTAAQEKISSFGGLLS